MTRVSSAAPRTPAPDLTHLGAREYDPNTGRFISVDPLMDLSDPQQMHGYAYANNNPVTFNDATGLACSGPDGIGCGHKVSKQGYGDQRDPNNKAKYDNDRQRWKDNSDAAQVRSESVLRDGDVRCADGANFCKRSGGAAARAQQRMKEEALRASKEILSKQGGNLGSPPKNIEQFLVWLLGELAGDEFKSISVCGESGGGALWLSTEAEVCQNIDIYGLSHSSEIKRGFNYGADISASFTLKINTDRADELSNKIQRTTSAGTEVGFGPHFSVVYEEDRTTPPTSPSRSGSAQALG